MQCSGIANIYPSSFQNLVRLYFKVNNCNWHLLPDLLHKAPSLETLVVTEVSLLNRGILIHLLSSLNLHLSAVFVVIRDMIFFESSLFWKERKYDPNYLSSHLTSFYDIGFKDLKDEVKLVKYILKEARVLKIATIQVSSGKSKESVFEKLSMFPRRLTTCLLILEYLNEYTSLNRTLFF